MNRWEEWFYDWLFKQPKGRRERQLAVAALVMFCLWIILMWLDL